MKSFFSVPYLKNVGVFALAQAIAAALAFLYTVFAARFLGVMQYGLFQSLMGIYGIFWILIWPLNLATIHCVGVSSLPERPKAAGEFIRLALIVSAASALFLGVFSPLIAGGLNISSAVPVLAVAYLVIATSVMTTFYGALQGSQAYSHFSVVKITQTSLCLITGVILMAAGFGVLGALGGYCIAMTCILIYFFSRRGSYRLGDGFRHAREEIHAVGWISGVFATVVLMDTAPMIVARIRLTGEGSGYFGAIFNLRNIVWPFAFAITFPFYSHILSRESEKKDVLKNAIALLLCVSGVFIAAGIVSPRAFFRLIYGSDFLKASAYMAGYGLALMLETVAMVLMFYQIARKKMRPLYLVAPLFALTAVLSLFGESIGGLIMAQILSALSCFAVLLSEKIFLRAAKSS